MKKQNTLISMILIGGLFIPLTGSAHNYRQTSGYPQVLNLANQLRGISFNDNRYNAYCNRYAQVAVSQANQRTSQQCTTSIPTPNANLKNRWSKNSWVHKSWCRSVSAYATKAESGRREGGLKNCFRNHRHQPTRAQIRSACIANDTMHKKAASGDYNYVRNCLQAGVSPNIREGNRWVPLHSAARNGRLGVVKLLVQSGASVNARDVTNRTPRDQAHLAGRVATENYLRWKGGILTR